MNHVANLHAAPAAHLSAYSPALERHEFHPDILDMAANLGFKLRDDVPSETRMFDGIEVNFSSHNAMKLGSIRLGAQAEPDSVVLTLSSVNGASKWQTGPLLNADFGDLAPHIPERFRALFAHLAATYTY